MKTIATINFKGGVGKTTVTWCLGDVLSNHPDYPDYNVLLFDLDAQASLTQAIEFGEKGEKFTEWMENSKKADKTTYVALQDFLRGRGKFNFQPDDNFIYKMRERYHFVPATSDLYWLGLDALEPEKGRVFVRRMLEKIKNSSNFPKYDYVIFDCPPSFTPLSYSVLTFCDLVLIPTNPDFFATKGVDLLAEAVRNKIETHPFPKTAVFANQVRGSRQIAGIGEIIPFWESQYYIRRIGESCEKARQENSINFHFLESWLPQRVSIKRAITNRETPKEFFEYFSRLWKEIEEVMK